jgi:hypothetical protein
MNLSILRNSFLASNLLAVGAAAQEGSDLVVVTEKRDVKFVSALLEDKAEVPIAAAFEELRSELADTQPAVNAATTNAGKIGITVTRLLKDKV